MQLLEQPPLSKSYFGRHRTIILVFVVIIVVLGARSQLPIETAYQIAPFLSFEVISYGFGSGLSMRMMP
jgi:hypothetical protein